MKFQVNALIEFIGNTPPRCIERILYIDPHGQNLVRINIFDRKALPIWQPVLELEQAFEIKDIHILEQDPLKQLHLPEDSIPELHRRHRDRAWEIIKSLVQDEQGNPRVAVFIRQERGRLVALRTQETTASRKTIYAYLRQYWQNGQTKNTLLPGYDRCGGRGKERKGGQQKLGRPSALARIDGDANGIVVDDQIKKCFERGIKLFYENKQRLPLTKAFQRTLETYFNRGYELQDGVLIPILPPASELPTFRQFQYWYSKHQDLERATKARLTEKRFNLSYRPILGNATQMAFGPGSIFQIDATVADIYLVSAVNPGRIIGRPVLYIVVDVFSRVVTGFSVGLEGPSWLGAMLALENVNANKVAFCAEHGITITEEEWPVHHLPKEIVADRGELEGYNADQIVNGLGINVSNTAPYRAEWKAIVERNFRLVNDQALHWIPGAVYLRRERGEKDYRLDACLNLAQFRSLLIRLFLFHNRFHELKDYKQGEDMRKDQVELYPLDLWNWGLRNRAGQLRKIDQEIVRLNLLPEAEASVTEKGIIFRQHQYDSQIARDEQWYLQARSHGRWKIKVAYDPRRLDVIYLRLENGKQLEPCFLHPNEITYQNCNWYEILDQDELERQKEPARRSRRQQAEAVLDAQIASLVEPAQQAVLAERQGQTRSAAVDGILENRAREREIERKTGAWQLESSSESTEIKQPDETDTQAGYIPPPRNIELLRELDKELKRNE